MSFELNRGLEPLTNPQTFQFATWDIEASEWWNLILIGVWDGERYVHFQDVSEFIRFLLQKRYNHWRFFAHFGGRYDINFIFDWLRTQEEIDVHFYCSGAMVIRMTLRYHGITVHLCDSYRLFYMPAHSQITPDNKGGLRQLGIAFNVEHKKSEIDFRSISYNRECIEYNEQDCRCLYEVIERFFAETGVFSETYASHALKVWRKDFLHDTIWKPNPTVLNFVRQSYCAGRVEIFKREATHCYAYDVNSMYPFVMQAPMPTEYVGESRKLLCDPYYGFIEAEVLVPESYIPCLPVPMEKLYFPMGHLRGVWSVEELIEAENRGAKIQKIHHGFYFKCHQIFKEYVEKLYALKKRSGEPTRTIAKGLLNALYGKFGQNPTKKVYCLERTAPDGATPIIYDDGNPSGFAYFERTSNSAYLLPHISAAITSKARLHLLGRLDESSFYCDTDSTFTTRSLSSEFIGDELGQWSLVGSGEATFIQPKLYKWKGIWKSKGLNREQSIDDFVSGNKNTMHRVRSIKEALRTGNPACAHILIEKYMRDSRPKRAWMSDGQETRPWDIKELEQ